jgi:hypothetical protein
VIYPNAHLADEERIVWVRDPKKYTYLREGIYATCRRKGPPPQKTFHVVGYAEHRKAAYSFGVYMRRFWWLKDHDRDLDPLGVYKCGCPCEAVKPDSIGLGQESAEFREAIA